MANPSPVGFSFCGTAGLQIVRGDLSGCPCCHAGMDRWLGIVGLAVVVMVYLPGLVLMVVERIWPRPVEEDGVDLEEALDTELEQITNRADQCIWGRIVTSNSH